MSHIPPSSGGQINAAKAINAYKEAAQQHAKPGEAQQPGQKQLKDKYLPNVK